MPVCCYVLETWTTDKEGKMVPPNYCGKKVGWKMVKDDDENTVRKYNPFCDEHQKIVDAEPDEEDYLPEKNQ